MFMADVVINLNTGEFQWLAALKSIPYALKRVKHNILSGDMWLGGGTFPTESWLDH